MTARNVAMNLNFIVPSNDMITLVRYALGLWTPIQFDLKRLYGVGES